MQFTFRAASVVALVCSVAVSPAHAEEKQVYDAEYAVRWMPSSGGPATAAKVLKTLGLESPKADGEYDVRYFDVKPVSGFPKSYDAIARERVTAGAAKTMYKMRGPDAFPPFDKDSIWKDCPLQGQPSAIESKHEMDISWVTPLPSNGGEKRSPSDDKKPVLKTVYSVSCSIEAGLKQTVPARLSATQVGCAPHVVRVKDKKVTVEHWVLSNGKALFEVSKKGKSNEEDQAAFYHDVVKPLLDEGIVPMGESKTVVASSC